MIRFLPMLSLVACSPPYEITVAAAPKALSAHCRLYLEPTHFDNLKILEDNPAVHKTESEDEWQATKKPASQQSWRDDKARFAEIFAKQIKQKLRWISREPMPGAYILRPALKYFSLWGESHMVLQVVAPDGDTVVEEATSVTTRNNYSVGGMMSDHALIHGDHFEQFVEEHLAYACAP